MEPLIVLLFLHLYLIFSQVGMEIRIPEYLAGAIVKDCSPTPFFLIFHISRMGLLVQALVHILLRIADFRPAVMPLDLRSGVGVDHGNDALCCFNLDCCHYAISFTFFSMKSISSWFRPYFL